MPQRTLSHGALRAAQRTPKRRMAPAGLKEIAQSVLPLPHGGDDARTVVRLGQRREKDLALLDAALGHLDGAQFGRVAVDFGFKGVAGGQLGRGRHVDHQGKIVRSRFGVRRVRRSVGGRCHGC